MQTASVTDDGDCQSVRLPPDIHFDEDQVFVKRVGKAVMLVPKRFSQSFEPVSDDFMVERIQHPQPPRETAFE